MQHISLISHMIRSIGFLTRLPVPQRWQAATASQPESDSLRQATRAFALVGALLGFLAGIGLIIANGLHFPPLASSLVAIALLALMTGALHEDGLGDTVDGFFGASMPEKRLEIMKDSRIGTFAALTLFIWTGLKATLLAAIIERAGANLAAMALIGSEALSRVGMLAIWHGLPSARPGGLADKIGTPEWESVVFAAITGLAIYCVTIWPSGGISAILFSLLLTTGLIYGFSQLCLARIGGQTGDTLGAAQQIGSLATLAGLVACP